MTTVSSFSTRSRPLNPLASSPEWTHARFERAVDIIQSLPKSGPIQTNYDDKLSLYASYKQATEGDINTSRPGLLDVLGRAKWDAWNKRKGLTQMQAERAYVEALIRILKGYADRTQAVELLKELETFSLPRPGLTVAGHGSIAPSRTDSTHSSDSDSSSTASYDDRRSMPPPPLPSSSRHHHQHHPTRSSRTLAPLPPASVTGGRSRPAHSQTLPQPAPADAVAPPLPGYGPPRTQPDVIRHSPRRTHRHRRRRSREYSSSDSETGSGSMSGSESEEEDTRNYHPAASHRSYTPVQQHQQRQQPLPPSSQRGPPSLPPHPSQLASHALRPPPPFPMPSSLRSVAGSERSGAPPSLPHGAGQAQQIAVAYPPGFVPAQAQRILPPPSIAPLTATNLRTGTPTTPASVAGAVPIQPRPELDAALQRIQTSLTALHERLSLLESTPSPSSSSALTSASSPLALVRELVRRIFILLRLRSRPISPPSSPNLSFRHPARPPTPSLLSLLFRLSASLFRTAKRTVGDALVVFAVVVILGRMRGVDVPRLVSGWVIRYAVGAGAGSGGRGERGRLGGA
ncbi:hypothetical protein JCM11251_002015 [Rhodosporidiobolus azoricus]